MNQKELLDFTEKTFKELLDILKKKNQDYTNSSKDVNAFKNFCLIEHYNVGTVEQGFFSRLSDKFSRLATFISAGELHVKNESVEDTLKDLANYSILLLAYIESKKPKAIMFDAASITNQAMKEAKVGEDW